MIRALVVARGKAPVSRGSGTRGIMSTAGMGVETSSELADRRTHARLQIRSLVYVQLDEANGGIVLNVSEGGLAVQAFTSVMDDSLPHVRFKVPFSNDTFDAEAQVSWTAQSRKLVGLNFSALPGPAVAQLRDWLSVEAARDPALTESKPPAHRQPQTSAPPVEIAVPVVRNLLEVPDSNTTPSAIASAGPAPPPSAETGNPDSVAISRTESSPLSLAEASRGMPTLHSKRTLAALFASLAVLSLFVGWLAGTRRLGDKAWALLGFAQNGSARKSATQSAAQSAPRITEIETIDANNQTWTIAVNPPTSAGSTAGRSSSPNASPSLSPPDHSPPMAIRTWVLSPPSRPRDAGISRSEDTAPPIVNDPAGAQDRILTSSQTMALPRPEPDLPPPTGQGTLKNGVLIRRVDPIYPPLARDQRLGGTIKLRITVGADGAVRDVAFLSGPQVFVDASERAVRLWRYAPTELDGKPIETVKEIVFTFRPESSSR